MGASWPLPRSRRDAVQQVQLHLQVFGIGTLIDKDRLIRQQRRFDAAADPQILCVVLFDLFAASGDGGDGGDAVVIHRGPCLSVA